MKKKSVFITVNYNNSNFTIEFIKSVLKQDLKDTVDVYIIDNHSQRNDIEKIERFIENHDNIYLLKNSENIGYFPAFNIALKEINLDKYNFYILGNNDLIFDKLFLKTLNMMNVSEQTLVISPNIITSDGYHQNPYFIKPLSKNRKLMYKIYFSNFITFNLMLFLSKFYRKKNKNLNKRSFFNEELIIHMGHGACFILTNFFFNNFSSLDDRVFLWGEEALLSGQVRSKNGHILYVPSLLVTHNASVSVSKITSYKKFKIMKKSYQVYKEFL